MARQAVGAVANWEQAPTVSTHNLHESPLFDDALVELLDNTAREHLCALHMGTDLLRPDENRLALHDHLSGRELLDAVRDGRLWLNAVRKVQPEQLADLSRHRPGDPSGDR